MNISAGDDIELEDGRRLRGFAEQGFGRVMDTFVANFVHRDDLGAGCSVYVDGEPVVDVWGGVADRRSGREWGHDTPAVIFSCSKGVLAICAYRLVEEGRLELDAPIARYWPEFAANGKSGITVRDALTHRAGLPALDADLSKRDVLAWDRVIQAIESAHPIYSRTEGYFYHAMTYGWLVGEVIRRITGEMPGRYFRRSLAEPLGLDTWIGLPREVRERVAWMEAPLPDEDSEAARESARLATANPLVDRSLTMCGAFAFPAEDDYVTFNDAALQECEIPGANGISTARSLARVYAACVAEVDGLRILSTSSLDDACREQSAGKPLSGLPDDGSRWGTGFQLASPPSQPMLGVGSFGHAGAGGQLAFGDRDHRIGFAYLSNQMGGYGDARARDLSIAVRAALGA